MCGWPEYHGYFPPVVASADAIFLVGGDRYGKPNKRVSKYDPLTNRWDMLNDKPRATNWPTTLCTDEFFYCIGGTDETGNPMTTVERMDLRTMEWSSIADLNPKRNVHSAAEWGGKIYVFYVEKVLSVASWNPVNNRWSDFKEITTMPDRWELKKALVIDDRLFLFSSNDIVEYDVEKNTLSTEMSFNNMEIQDAVSL